MSTGRFARCEAAAATTVTDCGAEDDVAEGAAAGPSHARSSNGRKRGSDAGSASSLTTASSSSSLSPSSSQSLSSSLSPSPSPSPNPNTSPNTSTSTPQSNNIPLASVANQFALDQNRIGLHENDPRAFVSLCLSYKNDGECEFTSEQCANVHGDVCEMCGHAALHPYNEFYKRKHITSCVREHEINMEHSFAIARSRDKTCGICLEVVVEKTHSNLFGILSNCGHCFCVDCIRKWRTQRNYNLNIVRSCPMCRQSSDFVCPSRFWVEDGDEKERLIADYKQKCASKACRHFQAGAGICPFGNKCFYLHALPNGTVTDVGPPPSSLPQNRRNRRRRGSRPSRLDRELAALLLMSASTVLTITRPPGSSQSPTAQSLSMPVSLQAFIETAVAASAASASWSLSSSPERPSSPVPPNEAEENGSVSSSGATADDGDASSISNDSDTSRQRRRRRDIAIQELDDDFDEIQFDFEGFRFSLRDLIFEVMDEDDTLDFLDP